MVCCEHKGDAGGIYEVNNYLTNNLYSSCSSIESVLKPFMHVIFRDPHWFCSRTYMVMTEDAFKSS